MRRFLFLLLFSTVLGVPLSADDWPQWMGPTRDGVWPEAGLIEKFPDSGPTIVWRVSAGAGYAGPAVAGGRVFVMDRESRPTPDTSKGLQGVERLRALDVATGLTLWERSWDAPYLIDYASGPRATPTIHDGLVYALGAEGHLVCVRADTGATVWERALKSDFLCSSPTWGFSGHPLIWNDLLLCLVGGQGTTAVAFDHRTGAERWRALSSSQAGYCPPTLINNHGREEVIYWHGEAINSLDPATGKVHWTVPRPTRFGVSMAMPRQVDDFLLVSAFWWGSRMMRLQKDQSEPEVVWETTRESDTRTEHLNALMCTPLHHNGFLYGVCSYGQLRCLEWKSGRRQWETLAATSGASEERWSNAFLTRLSHPSEDGHRFIIFNEKGELILARLTPEAYQETSRASIVAPDCPAVKDRPVVWTHPAYAGRRAYVKNNSEIVCVDLARTP